MLHFSKKYAVAALGALGLAAAMTQPAAAANFRGIEFAMGEASFADEVVDFNKVYAGGMSKEKAYTKNWHATAEAFDDPNSVLGVANSSWRGHSMPVAERDDYSLGKGGSITVKFTDNFLTGSGDDQDDLWIFEAGGLVEGMFVDISADGSNWESVGKIGGTQHAGIDIDAFGFTSDDLFSYVRITDDGKNTYTEGWAGADIDAIGAISSKDVPEPASLLGLLTIGSFITSSELKRR